MVVQWFSTPPNQIRGEDVLITAFLENSGNIATDGEFDAVLYADGTEINRFRSPSLDPVAPSGTGSDVSFQTSWSGGLGNHEFRLVLDPMKNLTQAREDNDAYETTLSILPHSMRQFPFPPPQRE